MLQFGTDGVRGVALSQLTEEFVNRLGFVAARTLAESGVAESVAEQRGVTGRGAGQRFVIGADTRESSPQLAAALAAGTAAAGAEVIDLSVVATPVVSFACQIFDCSGAMVSASHNQWTDNGVKLFAAGGTKLDSETEQAIAEQVPVEPGPTGMPSTPQAPPASPAQPNLPSANLPATNLPTEVLSQYERSLAAGIAQRNLDGLHLVVDTANGATAPYAADMLRRLGARVTAIFDSPNGRNINDGCGSLHPQATQAEVVRTGADLGLCFDGDGDRLVAVDSAGNLINGDRLLVLFACDLAEAGELSQRTLVTTVMSNLGLREALSKADIEIHQTPVGDRHVFDAIEQGGFDLGGEQSGHIIFRRLAATGDGLRSGVQLADLFARARATGTGLAGTGQTSTGPTSTGPTSTAQTSADIAAAAMTEYPQVLKNITLSASISELPAALEHQINEIADNADPHTRVLVRPSGTEPLVRVMVEAADSDYANQLADEIVAVVRTEVLPQG